MRLSGKRLGTVGVLVFGSVIFGVTHLYVHAQQASPRRETPPASATTEEPTADTTSSPSPSYWSSGYVIGAEDVLDIDVYKAPDLNQTVRVANDGTIPLRLLGNVKAAGLTVTQLRAELEAKLKETYFEDPHVTVFVKEYHAQPVSVIGAVEKPGMYELIGPRSLIQVLSMAGGLAKRASAPAGRMLYVTRKGGFGDLAPAKGMRLVSSDKAEIDLKDLLYSHEDALNIDVKPFDVISVTKADVVYVLGRGVQKPGGFVLEDRDRVTVLQALALAEGLSANAAKHDARLIHVKPDGTRDEIPLDLDKVLRGKAPDPDLAANDILFVPDSAQKAALKRGLDATIATISGVLIFRRP